MENVISQIEDSKQVKNVRFKRSERKKTIISWKTIAASSNMKSTISSFVFKKSIGIDYKTSEADIDKLGHVKLEIESKNITGS